ncbi:MAG TPA: hypothetical protein VJ806_06295 [Luteimonas sp.]|nr:hypothetical protein [Luteimonas sp.]
MEVQDQTEQAKIETDAGLREIGLEILGNLEKHFGIDLKRIVADESLDSEQAYVELRASLAAAVLSHAGYPVEDREFAVPGPLAKGVENEPNVFITQHNANIAADYSGERVREYVIDLTRRLDLMSRSNSVGSLVGNTIGGFVIAVGIGVGKEVGKRLFNGDGLKDALTGAIGKVGLKTALLAVVGALAGILKWMIFDKQARILGVVINDTDTDFVVRDWRKSVDGYHGGDLYMAHGATKNFMSDHLTGDLDSPEVQLKARIPGKTPEERQVAIGIYFADRKSGFYGAEGLYVFTPLGGGHDSVAVQFAVPFSKANNANIALHRGGSINNKSQLEGMFRALYNEKKVNVDKREGPYRLRSHINSPSGGVVSGIACISKA